MRFRSSDRARVVEAEKSLAAGVNLFQTLLGFASNKLAESKDDNEKALVPLVKAATEVLASELARDKRLPRAMILMDMIGDRDLAIRREAHSAPWLTDIIWNAAARLGYGRHFLRDMVPVEDDHVPFLRLGVAATLLIDFDFPVWHTAGDTLDTVSADSLTVVGQALLEALPSIEQYLSRESGRP